MTKETRDQRIARVGKDMGALIKEGHPKEVVQKMVKESLLRSREQAKNK